MNRPLPYVLISLVVIVGVSKAGLAAQPARKKPSPPLFVGSPTEHVRHVFANLAERNIEQQIEELGRRIAIDPQAAAAVLDELEKAGAVEAATLEAELLLWLARGNDVRDGKPEGVMPTEQLGPRAARLLEHPDPFVASIAEWAIATRLGADYEGAEEKVAGRRIAKRWPGDEAPAWFKQWAAIGVDKALELDYVRQAAAVGAHRSSAALLNAGQKLAGRAEALVAYIRHTGEPAQITAAEAASAKADNAWKALEAAAEQSPGELTKLRKCYLDLRRAVRDVALANPDINFPQIVFGLRQAARQGGNITNGRWNTCTPGGDILIKTGWNPADPVVPLLAGRLGPGHVRGLELDWDARKLVFAFAPQRARSGEPRLREKNDIGGYFGQGTGETEEMSHLYEVQVDGGGLRQLTHARHNADQEPTYLPNGDIVFVSDRSNFGSQCAGALEQDNMILNLYRCDANGRNIRALSNNKDFDRHPHLMDTGQVLFLHWEYQERHLWQTHTLWTCRPDGSGTDALYKQHIPTGPMSLREARQIFGQRKLVAIACGHHNYDQGAVFLVDYAAGINERNAMRNVTPGVSATEGGYGGIKPVPEGGVEDRGGHYMFPYPLSDKSFLVCYSYKRPERLAGQNYSLYYVDVWGNKELVHRDKRLSVAFVSPLRPTPRPPVLPESPPSSNAEQRFAVACVANVHADWPAEAGKAKYLRISQKVPWPCVRDETKACGFNDLHWMPAAWEPVLGMWDWGHARVIGIVPVEADGSAHFRVPADQTVYFQALDENFLELRRMRSNVTFRQRETRTCVGCHESKTVAPPAMILIPLAFRRAPSTPEPPPWGDRVVSDFERHVQPIFEQHCVRCHGEQEPDGGLQYTSRPVDGYMQSYRTIFGLKPTDPTPFAKGWWTIWRPGEPPLSEEAAEQGKTFLKNVLRNPSPAQQVAVADYTGGSEVSQPLQFGSGKSKLTLTLLNDPLHRREVKLERNEWLSLVTWVDLNAQYWGTFVEKDGHFASCRAAKQGKSVVPPRRVRVEFPDPWAGPPAGEWRWRDDRTVVLKP